MEAAITVARYYIPHARKAHARMDADLLVEQARRALAWIERHQERGKPWKLRDCYHSLRRRAWCAHRRTYSRRSGS